MGYALPRQRIVNWFSSRKKKMLLACEVSRYLEFLIKLHSLGFLFYQHLPHRGQLGREFGGHEVCITGLAGGGGCSGNGVTA